MGTEKTMDYSGSILFLGSGFTTGATNINSQPVPAGGGLKKHFLTLLGMQQSDYDIRTLADTIASTPGLDLYNELYRLFTIKYLKDFQQNILAKPWLRIYTTNYDDAVELARHKGGLSVHSYDYNDPKPAKIHDGAIIHLHGSIRKTNATNVLNQLVLNEQSYVRQHFEKSDWYYEFSRDLRFCTSCYFIGYSLNDYHLSALLLAQPETARKTVFVTNTSPDKIFCGRVSPYGSILPIGAEQFSSSHCTLPQEPKPLETYRLKSFKHLNPYKDNKSTSDPTPLEVLNLLTLGHFNPQRCFSSLPASSYIVSRNRIVNKAAEEINGKTKCLLVHSHLGNGKSIFLHALASRLAENGFNCYICTNNPSTESIIRDIEKLNTSNKNVIIFDTHNAAMLVLSHADRFSDGTKFVIATRTSTQEVRLHEILKFAPRPHISIDLNTLTKEDKADFVNLIKYTGIYKSSSATTLDNAKDFRDIVTTIYKNESIKSSIKSHISPILDNDRLKNIVIATHIFNWIGHNPDPYFLRNVVDADIYIEFNQNRELLVEFFHNTNDGPILRSSLFSEHVLSNYIKPKDILDTITVILLEAIKLKQDRFYNPVVNQLMRFTRLRSLLENYDNNIDLIENFYNRLHRDIEINKEPLFWLQYSILMTEVGNLQAAEHFLTTSYSRAADINNFKTYQIDTHALRLLLLIESSNIGPFPTERIDLLFAVLGRVATLLPEESHRDYVIRSLAGMEIFITSRYHVLTRAELVGLLTLCRTIRDSLDKLQRSERFSAQTETAAKSMHRISNFLQEKIAIAQPAHPAT